MFTENSSTSANEATQQATPAENNQDPSKAIEGNITEPSEELKQKLDQIAKRDRFLSQRERKIAELERGFSERENGLKSKYSRFEGLDEIKNPAKLLDKLGFSIDEILEASLSSDDDDYKKSDSHKDRQIEELKQQIEAIKNKYDDDTSKRQQDEEERQIAYQKNIIQNIIGSNADKYPYINALGKDAIESIWSDIYDSFKESGTIPDYEQFLQKSENGAREYIKKFTKISNFVDHMDLQKAPEKKEPEPENRNFLTDIDPWSGSHNETLSNKDDSDGRLGERFSSYDEDDLIREASKLIKWDANK
jgi:hypothetical protein